MFYLAHISDIHLTPMPKIAWRELLNKRITGYINLNLNRKLCFNRNFLDRVVISLLQQKPDHLVISGDIVNLGTFEEFINGKIWLENLSKKIPLSISLGNHDAYVKGSLKQACNIFANWLKSDVDFEQDSYFPNVKIQNGVAIINVCTAIATLPFFATGYFSKKQAKNLEKILYICGQQNLFRIINIHHPPMKRATNWHKKLWGIRNFKNAIKSAGAELILHGHTHKESLEYMLNIPVIGVGSASKPCTYNANYNIFGIEKADNRWHCILTRYGANSKGDIIKKSNITL